MSNIPNGKQGQDVRPSFLATTQKDTAQTLTEKRQELRDTELKFQKACRQLAYINHRLADLTQRYNKARRNNQRTFRYNLKLKISVIEGIKSMFYEYIYMKAEDINMLRHDVRFWIEESSESEYETDDEEWNATHLMIDSSFQSYSGWTQNQQKHRKKYLL